MPCFEFKIQRPQEAYFQFCIWHSKYRFILNFLTKFPKQFIDKIVPATEEPKVLFFV